MISSKTDTPQCLNEVKGPSLIKDRYPIQRLNSTAWVVGLI